MKNKEIIIGFLGRMSSEKNLEVLIGAIPELKKKIKNWKILLAGPRKIKGEEIYENKIKKLIADNKEFVKDLGELKEVSGFLKKCDCLVLPSNNRLESFGIVQIEAMRLGTPCVTTNSPGMNIPINKTGMGELFENNNPIDLANKIVKVIDRGKKYYQDLGKNNLKIFDYEKAVDNYEKIF